MHSVQKDGDREAPSILPWALSVCFACAYWVPGVYGYGPLGLNYVYAVPGLKWGALIAAVGVPMAHCSVLFVWVVLAFKRQKAGRTRVHIGCWAFVGIMMCLLNTAIGFFWLIGVLAKNR